MMNRSVSVPIPISKPVKTEHKYSLNENVFDPSESSPPTEFMLKLYLRMSHFHPSENTVFNQKK